MGDPSADGLIWYWGAYTVSLKLNYLLKLLFELFDEDVEFVQGYEHISPVNYLLGCLLLHQSRLIRQRDQEHTPDRKTKSLEQLRVTWDGRRRLKRSSGVVLYGSAICHRKWAPIKKKKTGVNFTIAQLASCSKRSAWRRGTRREICTAHIHQMANMAHVNPAAH